MPIRNVLKWVRKKLPGRRSAPVESELAFTRMLIAKLLISQFDVLKPRNGLRDAEFKVFSQFGEDGIIQYLIRQAEIHPQNYSFIEFGVENYLESNTRFLLLNDNWRGLVMDGCATNVDFITQDAVSWRHDLTAIHAFVNAANINNLLCSHGYTGDIGLLSIDIDGMDYWVWEAITAVRPSIVVIEYNSVFGCQHAITVPYDPQFQRTQAHFSNLFWGASLPALCQLARRKGYAFVGCNSNGNNAFFVLSERLGRLQALEPKEGYVESRFRESRNERGELSFKGGSDRVKAIEHLVVFDVVRKRLIRIGDLPFQQAGHAA